MLAELFDRVFARLDTRFTPELATYQDRKDGSLAEGYFGPNGNWNQLSKGPAQIFHFPLITVHSAESLIAYAESHASDAISGNRAILNVNRNGLLLSVDYGKGEKPEEMKHRVQFPAAFDEECEGAAKAILAALGNWIGLDKFDALLDKCAPFISNFAALESAAANMEGHETAKIGKTANSYNIQVTGEVSCTVDIPKFIAINLLFMGRPISAEIPLRLTVSNKQVQFHLVDNGSLPKAQMATLKSIKDQVANALPELLVIDGKLG